MGRKASEEKKLEKVIDPVCGREVEVGLAVGSIEVKGRKYHFCSVWCKKMYGVEIGGPDRDIPKGRAGWMGHLWSQEQQLSAP